MSAIPILIINSPYKVPTHYWKYDREKRVFDKIEGRRPAGYVIATESSQIYDDPGIFHEIPLVNKIRKEVYDWRKKKYPGISETSKRLRISLETISI